MITSTTAGKPNRTRIRRRIRDTVATTIATVALVLSAGVVSGPAYADDDYPSWDDVKNAQASESSKQEEVTRIQGLIETMNRMHAHPKFQNPFPSNETVLSDGTGYSFDLIVQYLTEPRQIAARTVAR